MIVSDTSPLNYLVLIGQAQILEVLYGAVAIPPAVAAELQAESTPLLVREWRQTLPSWCSIQPVATCHDPALGHLHPGEREAILLAQAIGAEAVLVDERDGRHAATARSLRVTGTLGVLDEAAEQGLLKLPRSLALLQHTSFHATNRLYEQFLARDADRKRQGFRPLKIRQA